MTRACHSEVVCAKVNVSGDLSKWTVGSDDCTHKSSELTVNVNELSYFIGLWLALTSEGKNARLNSCTRARARAHTHARTHTHRAFSHTQVHISSKLSKMAEHVMKDSLLSSQQIPRKLTPGRFGEDLTHNRSVG